MVLRRSAVTSTGGDQWRPSTEADSWIGSPGPLPSQTAYSVPDTGSAVAAGRQQRMFGAPKPTLGVITCSGLQVAPPSREVRTTKGVALPAATPSRACSFLVAAASGPSPIDEPEE